MGRLRDPEVDEAIKEATLKLLTERGYEALSIEAIAAHAGVGKTSIYRRWPSKAELVFAAAVHPSDFGEPPDKGSLQADLEYTSTFIVDAFSSPAAREALPALMSELAHRPELAAALSQGFLRAENHWIDQLVARAVRRGELPVGTDPEFVLDLVRGPVFTRAVFAGRPVSHEFGRQVASAVARALTCSPS